MLLTEEVNWCWQQGIARVIDKPEWCIWLKLYTSHDPLCTPSLFSHTAQTKAFALLSSSPEHLQRKFLLRPKQANVSKVRERTAVSFTQTTLSTTLLLIRLPHKIQALGAKKFAYIALVQPLSLVSIALIGHKHTFHNDKSCIVSTMKKVERMQTRAVTQLHIDVNAESTLSYIPNTRTY